MCLSPAELPTESVVFSYGDTEAVGLGSADSKNEALLRGQATVPRRLLLWGALKTWHWGGGGEKQNKDADGDSL
jgi:hypothetical protein